MKEKHITIQIFEKIRTPKELELVCASFKWLIDNGFMEPSPLLHMISLKAFRRIHKV